MQELTTPGFVKCNELFSAVCYKYLAFPSRLSAKPTGIPFMFCKREQRYIFLSWYLRSHIAQTSQAVALTIKCHFWNASKPKYDFASRYKGHKYSLILILVMIKSFNFDVVMILLCSPCAMVTGPSQMSSWALACELWHQERWGSILITIIDLFP